MLKCPNPQATKARQSAFQALSNRFSHLHTPRQIITTIKHGSLHWVTGTPPNQVHAPTRGSLVAGDPLLTTAFLEQFHSIGWLYFFLGRISISWENAYCSYLGSSTTAASVHRWSTQLILSLWEYVQVLWKHCNQVVHGTAEDRARLILQDLHREVSSLYQQYQSTPEMILPRHSRLFTQKTLEEHLTQSYDEIICWLRSVSEARAVLQHQEDLLRSEATRFFPAADGTLINNTASNHASYTSTTSYTSSTNSALSLDIASNRSSSMASTVTYFSDVDFRGNQISQVDT